MRKIAAEHTLMACMVAILLTMAMVAIMSYSVLSGVNKAFETAVNSTARKLQLAGDINMDASDMLAAQRGVSVYTNTAEANMRRFDLRSGQIDSDAAELKSLSVDREELRIIGVVEDSNASYRDTVHQVERLQAIDPDESRKVANAYETIDEITDQLEALESSHLKEALGGTRRLLRSGRIVWFVCGGIGLVVVLFALQSIHVMGEALRASAEQARVSALEARTLAEQAVASAAFSELLMNSMPCAICILDVKGNLKRGNYNFLGYSRADMLENGVLSLVEPESLEAVKRALVKTLEEGYAETEACLITKDGTKIPTYLTNTR